MLANIRDAILHDGFKDEDEIRRRVPSGIWNLRDVYGSLLRQAIPLELAQGVPVPHCSTIELWRGGTMGPLVVRIVSTAGGMVRLFILISEGLGHLQVKRERKLQIRKGHRRAA